MRYADPTELRRMFRELSIDRVSGVPGRDQHLARQGMGLHAPPVMFLPENDLVETISRERAGGLQSPNRPAGGPSR
jgi:hypothetical protein